MNRLFQAASLMRHYQIGVMEALVLATIHGHVEATADSMAVVLETTRENATAIIKRLRDKELIRSGTPRPVQKTVNGRTTTKTWRLTGEVRAQLDHFQNLGQFHPLKPNS